MNVEPAEISRIAARNGNWRLKKHFPKGKILMYERGSSRITIYYDVMSVETKLWHTKSRRFTSLLRENVDLSLLQMIFSYPRVHTDKGKYKYDTPHKRPIK